MIQSRQNQPHQGWTAEPNCGSGTASIIWQCITTIGLCTYVAVHPSVPTLPLNRFMTFTRKVVIVGIGLLAPELWAWLALTQLLAARNLVKQAAHLERPLSLKQAFFIGSGGIAIRGFHKHQPPRQRDYDGYPVTVHSGTLYKYKWDEDSFPNLSPEELKFFSEHVPSDEDLDDKSKQDNLAKLITSIQVLWSLIQIIARGQQGLEISLIQFGMVAYIAMGAFCYACWWHKPYDIERPHVVESTVVCLNGEPLIDVAKWRAAEREIRPVSSTRLKILPRPILAQLSQIGRLMQDVFPRGELSVQRFVNHNVGSLLCLIFGSIHLIPWNYPFPTVAEAWLWRGSSLGAMVLGVSLTLMWLANRLDKLVDLLRIRPVSALAIKILIFLPIMYLCVAFAGIYILGRFSLAIECFISFRDAPSSIYQQVDWSAYVPHLGA